jgi:hypothetical protein
VRAVLVLAIALLTVGLWRPSSIHHGSLVVAVPVATGWVVCGDTRKTSTVFAATEDETKVFALGPGVLAGATGLRRVIEQGTTVFDVAERVLAFARSRPFDGRDDYIEVLGKTLGDDFIRAVPTRTWPEIEALEAKSPSVFSVALFWVTRDGLPRWADARFHLKGGPRYATRSTRESLATRNELRPVVLGNLAVVDELQHGRLPAFDTLRRDAELRRFLMPPYAWRTQHAADAERFGRRLVETTSTRLTELQPGPSDVGPTADCLTAS